MRKLVPTSQLMEYFKSRPDLLIFEGTFARSRNAEIYNEGDNYALVSAESDRYKVCLSSTDISFADRVLSGLKGRIALSGADSIIVAELGKRYRLEWETDCMLYVWNGMPLPHKNVLEIKPMSPKFAQLVSDGTYYNAPVSEIEECLNSYPSAAVYIDDKPVCWCLCHLDKSLGMLFTLPEYRRRGYALEVMTYLCNEMISRGEIPFAYIVTSNIASMKLAEKYNLVAIKRADYCGFEKITEDTQKGKSR